MSIFKESFNPNVQNSLEARQNLMGKSIRTPQELTFLNSNTNFVSLKSSVDVNGDDGKLAKENVLIGGTLNNKVLRYGIDDAGEGAYSTKTSSGAKHVLGMRPMPGITSIEVHNKAAYGSTRIATVNFQCWDVEQLNILEALYMRPGYTVLLEFGRNNYIDTKGNLRQVAPTDDFFTKKNIVLIDYLNDLYKRSTDSGGNYDALFGYIINYGWSARNDGGYDCKIEIVTTGEILESLKVNYTVGLVDFASTIQAVGASSSTGSASSSPAPLPPATKGNKPKFRGLLHDDVNQANNNNYEYPYLVSYGRVNEEYSKNILSGLIYEAFRLCNMAEMGGLSLNTSTDPKNAGKIGTAIPPLEGSLKYTTSLIAGQTGSIDYAVIDYNSTNNTDPDYTIIKSIDKGDVFITLESFVRIINRYIMAVNPSSKGAIPLTRLSVYDRGYLGKGNIPLYCLYHPLMVSVNPDAVLVKNDKWMSLLANIKVDQNWVAPTEEEKGKVSGFIENPNMTAFIRKILKEFDYPEKFAFPAAARILKEIGDRGVKSKLSVDEFAKQFNEHYVWVRGGLESVGRENNTYKFAKFADDKSILERKLEKMAANLTRTFKAVFDDFITSVSDADFNILTDKKIQGYAKAVYNYDYSNSAMVKHENFLNNEVKLEEQRQQTQQTVNSSNLAASNTGKWWMENVDTKLKKDFIHVSGNQKFGTIGSIYLNTKFLYKMAKDPSLQQQDNSGKQSLLILNYLKAVMQEVQTSLGNVNNFEIIIDDRDGVGRIVDLNYVNDGDEKLFKFEIGSNNSIIKDIKIESEISNNMSSMIAIAAQSSAGAFGLDNSTLVSYNAGILDRMIPKKESPIYSLSGGPTELGVKIASFTAALSVIAKFFTSFGGNDISNPTGNFDAKNAESNKNALREIISFFTSVKPSSNKNKAFLPSKISLTIDGLSGIIIGNLFDVDKTFIPKFYKDGSGGFRDLGYIVVNVAHSISSNVWNTTVQGYPFIIEKIKAKDFEDYDFALIVDYDPLTNTITTSLDIISNKNLKGYTRSAYNKAEQKSPGFQAKVKEVAAAIGTTEEALIALMKAESGIDPASRSKISSATGLIQFMANYPPKSKPKTLYNYGGKIYTRDQLSSLGGVEQLDLVKAYFVNAGFTGVRPIGFVELYGMTFVPAMFKNGVFKSDNYIVPNGKADGEAFEYAKSNSVIAKFSNRAGVIDIAAFKKYCNFKLSETFM
jgi:hypothetical protein